MSSFAFIVAAFTAFHAISAYGDCDLKEVTDIPGIKYYSLEPERAHQAHRQVVVLPPTGGMNRADKSLAQGLCKRGHLVKILDYAQPSGHTTDLGIHDALSRGFLSTLEIFLKTEPRETVLVGASLGGMYASVAYGLGLRSDLNYPSLSKLRGIVITVAGGTLADVLASSEIEAVKKQRDLRFSHYGFSTAENYRNALLPMIQLDPLHLATPSARSSVLMFNSTNDTAVPSPTQEALWAAWGNPTVDRFRTNHVLTVGSVYYFYKETISEFILTLPSM